MSLLDHFPPPLSERRSWEGFHGLWAAALVEKLNRDVLPEEYYADMQVHIGSQVEVDIATLTERGGAGEHGTAMVLARSWVPPATELVVPVVFPDEIEVQVFATGTGADHDPITYSAAGLPAGLTLNTTTGLISGTIGPAAHGTSPDQLTFTASDGAHVVSQTLVWTVTPAIALANPGAQASAAGDTASLQVAAADLTGGTPIYSAAGLPSGLGINPSSGLISGTIAASAASNTPYTVTVTATDGAYTNSQAFAWTVAPILVRAPGDQANLDGDAVSLSLAAHYYGSGTLSYSATGLPTGLSINASTGLVSGTVASGADANGPFAVMVNVSDGAPTPPARRSTGPSFPSSRSAA